MMDLRDFTPRLGQGDLPDLSEYAVVSDTQFQRAMDLWDAQMPGYENLLSCNFTADREGIYTPIVEGDWRWLERSHRYRNRKTGEVINDGKWVDIRDAFTDAMHHPARRLTEQMLDRDINLHEWMRQMAAMIRDTHLAMFMLGCGGYNGISQDGVISLETTLREQFSYLSDFGDEIVHGNRGRLRQHVSLYTPIALRRRGVLNRSTLYIESSTSSAERGRVTTYGRLIGDLPAYPGDGSMVCRTNCRCHWRFNLSPPGGGGSVIHAFWRLIRRDRHNCVTCIQYSVQWNPYRLQTF